MPGGRHGSIGSSSSSSATSWCPRCAPTARTPHRSRWCRGSPSTTWNCSVGVSWCWPAVREPTRTSVSRGGWPPCSAARVCPTVSIPGGRSGPTIGHSGGRCCRATSTSWWKADPVGQQTAGNATDRRTAIRWMLRDLQALQAMLQAEMFETDVRRIGAEQEMFLVDASWQPAPGALAMLAALTGQPYTTEVGAFNLELNLDPQVFSGDCFARMHTQLDRLLALGHAAAETAGLHIVLTGTLPTIRKRDLSLDNMVPNPRYLALNDALRGLRGEDFYELHIKGADELRVRQDSVMAEACNASFQVHLQVTPDEFANAYNIAQAITGPTLASATNSPLLFGKRLWAETRIALFEQSVDTRRPGQHMRERSGRVTFGDGWVGSSVVDLYREDITRFRPVLSPDDNVDPMAELEAGRVPRLDALRLHTGTVWRWNRACFGISETPTGEVPHLRIENRVLPSGPSTAD